MVTHIKRIVLFLFVTITFVGCAMFNSQGFDSSPSIQPTSSSNAPDTPRPLHTTLSPTIAPPTGVQLTYGSFRDGVYGVYAIDVIDWDEPTFGNDRLLFEWPTSINTLDWSPDGKKVVFSTGYSGVLFLADWDGSNLVQITEPCASSRWPQWSPDGEQIAFIYNPGNSNCDSLGASQVRMYDVTTGLVSEILNDVVNPSRIYWLPDGNMAYVSQISQYAQTQAISFAKLTGEILSQYKDDIVEYVTYTDVDFSSDGKQMAFIRDQMTGEFPSDLFVKDLTTDKVVRLTSDYGVVLDSKWSPVGNWIALISDKTGNYDVYLISPGGGKMVNVTNTPNDETNPVWRINR